MTKYKSFETERLILRPTDQRDASFILELLNTPKWLEFIGDRKVYSLDDARNYIRERIHPQLEKSGFSNYTVILKSGKVKIGSCGLYDREGLEGIDIGFAFLPEYEGQGYAFECASKIFEAAIHSFKIEKICAITTRSNYKSQRLIEKLGLRFVKFTKMPNDPEELMYFEWSKEPH